MANITIDGLPVNTVLNGLERVPIAKNTGSAYVTQYTTVAAIAAAKNIQAFLNGSTSGQTVLQAQAVASGTITFPAATDQVVCRATTDTLTNKTFDTAGTGNVWKVNGQQITTFTGTGAVVLATAPTLTALNISGLTASSAVATDASKNLVSVAQTGTGSNVLATSPTLVTPNIGVATGTSLNLSGLTVSSAVATDGSNNLVSVATTGTGSYVLAVSPAMTGTPTVPTQSPGDNSTNIASTAYVAAAIAATIVRNQTFTASGTYTPNANMISAIIECVGGGGGGGGCAASTAGTINGAGGGGGGGYSRSYVTKAGVGASQTVTVGAAGTAGTAGTNSGGTGGDTSVGTLCVAKGGVGGTGAAAGTGTAGGAGGAAGSGTGNVTIGGSSGGNGRTASIVTVLFPSGGPGGSSVMGSGASSGGNGAAGVAGTAPGGGGSGGTDTGAGGARAGGAGAIGIVIITEFCSA